MRKVKLFTPVLILCLCLLLVSTAYPAKPQPQPPADVFYRGYAILYDTDTSGNPYMIASDGKGQYMDRWLTAGNPKTKRGDRTDFDGFSLI